MRSPERDAYLLGRGLPLDPPTCEAIVHRCWRGTYFPAHCDKPAVDGYPCFPRCEEHRIKPDLLQINS